jgi:hypothetical protein
MGISEVKMYMYLLITYEYCQIPSDWTYFKIILRRSLVDMQG